ncbi:restriction endonuclease subunit S [Acinetobacter sp. ANC 7201]|nr:restriction endonuclease subunit S [Acinetobacter sp. ANC 7201]WFP96916.1 restriction endonuclease subunit S [Acinetobacter sp. ANC 7201]
MVAPLLRFTEFTDDWEETTLENLAEVERGKFSVRPRNDPRYFGGEMPFVQTGDVAGSDMYLKGYSQTLNADGIKVSKVFPADTILITIAANIGDTTITRYVVACPDSVVAIQSKKDKANTIFLKNLIDLQKEVLDSQATQNAQKNINLQVLKPLELFAPSIEEQTKIAAFLSAVDEKISQLSQKHVLLSQYKQGMMQKLFSQQIRFKADDGSEFGEWEDKPLNEIASKRSGKNKDGSISEVLTNSATQGIIKQSDYFEREIVTESNLNGYYIVNLDDFVYNPRISVHAPVGPIKRNKKCLGVMSPLYTVFTVSEGNLAYLEYFFDSNFWHDYVKGVANSGARHDRMNITNKDFFDMPIFYPCLEEQTKIANFLSSIDQKIEVVAQQIEQAKTWKKGLLQQMFV